MEYEYGKLAKYQIAIAAPMFLLAAVKYLGICTVCATALAIVLFIYGG